MSDSAQPHRWQPARLPRSWDSPGKNTGVGCHFLLQCMTVKSESEVTQLCPTLHDPMDCSLPGSSIDGIFQARVLEWGAIAFSEPEPEPSQKLELSSFRNCEKINSAVLSSPVYGILLWQPNQTKTVSKHNLMASSCLITHRRWDQGT